MATCVQQLVWHLKKADLESLITAAAGNYTEIQFTMGVLGDSSMHCYVALVNENPTSTFTIVGDEKVGCPVPPGCTT